MNSASPACTKSVASKPKRTARSKVMRMAMPFRTALSLKALIAWVTNRGRKLGDFRIANWLWVSFVSPFM